MTEVIDGRYRLNSQIGAGGTARVYAATDTRLGRDVAVKLLDAQAISSADPEALRRFQREARSLAEFSHPNVVQVYDAGTTASGDPYIVLELVDGPSLAQLLDQRGRFPVDEAAGITDAVLAGLGAAHEAGLIHRDVKPANVLFDRAGTAKLADFGIARRFDEMGDSLTAAGMVVGTPRYLAPEQAAGQALTPATDVFAAGLLLQEMLVGAAAAATRTPPTVIELESVRPDVGEAVRSVIRQALHPDPRRRFQSTAAMAAALRHATAQVPPTAVSESSALPPTEVAPAAPQRLYLPRRRRRTTSLWWLALAAVVVLAVGAIAIAAIGQRDDNDLTARDTQAPTSAVETAVTPVPPPSTEPSPSTPPPSVPPPSVQPGPMSPLAAAIDLQTFVSLLTINPGMAGQHGEELRRGLDKILRSPKSAKTGDRIAELADQVQRWKSDNTLDEAIADHLLRLLDNAEDVG